MKLVRALLLLLIFSLAIIPLSASSSGEDKRSEVVSVSPRSAVIRHFRTGAENATVVECCSFRAVVVFSDGPEGGVEPDAMGYVTPLDGGEAEVLRANSSIFFIGNSSGFDIRVTGLTPASELEAVVSGAVCRVSNGSVTVVEVLYQEALRFRTPPESKEAGGSPFMSVLAAAAIASGLAVLAIALLQWARGRGRAIYLAPFLLIFAVVDVVPIAFEIFLSFTRYGMRLGESPKFVGLGNYRSVLGNNLLWIALTTTLVWGLSSVALRLLISFAIAYSIRDAGGRVKSAVLFPLFMTWIFPSYILLTAWRAFLFGGVGGSLFQKLFWIDVDPKFDKYGTFLLCIAVDVLTNLFLDTLAFLTALSSVSRELREAAKIDGLGAWERIRYVEIPAIREMVVPWILLDVLRASGSFDVVFFISGGGPHLEYAVASYGVLGATTTVSYFIFVEFYRYRNIGMAATYSVFKAALDVSMFLLWYSISRRGGGGVAPRVSDRALFASFSALAITGALTGHRYLGVFTMRPVSALAGVLSATYVVRRSRKTLVLAVAGSLLEIFAYALQLTRYELWYSFDFSILLAVPIAVIYAPKAFGLPRFREPEAEFKAFVLSVLGALLTAPYSAVCSAIFMASSLASALGCGGLACSLFMLVCGIAVALSPIPPIIRVALAVPLILGSLSVWIRRLRRFADAASKALLLGLLLGVELTPMVLVVKVAFDPLEDIVSFGMAAGASLVHFRGVVADGFLSAILNSAVLAVMTLALAIPPAVLAAYSLTRYQGEEGERISSVILCVKKLTGIATIPPLFIIIASLGLIDSLIGVAVAQSAASAIYSMWLLRGFFEDVPQEVIDSARVDGLRGLSLLLGVLVPLSASMLGFVVLVSFIRSWDSYIFQYLFLFSPEKFTIPVKLSYYVGEPGSKAPDWGLFAAGSVLSVIPVSALYAYVFSRVIERGAKVRAG